MIYVIDDANKALYGKYLLQMHRQRFVHFVEEKGWEELRGTIEFEVDQYDGPGACYIVCVEDGRMVASVRLLPVHLGSFVMDRNASHITAPEYQNGAPTGTWEMSRLMTSNPGWADASGNPAIRLVWLGMFEFLLEQGANCLIAAADTGLLDRIPPALTYREIGERSNFQSNKGDSTEVAFVEFQVLAEEIEAMKTAFALPSPAYHRAEAVLPAWPSDYEPWKIHYLNDMLQQNPEQTDLVRTVYEESASHEDSMTIFMGLLDNAVQKRGGQPTS